MGKTRKAGRDHKKRIKKRATIREVKRAAGFRLAFLAPAVILYGVFVLWPFIQTLYLSFFNWRGVSASKKFVGLENYKRLADDKDYWQAIHNTVWVLIVAGIILVVIGVVMAHAIQGQGRLAKLARATYLLPNVFSLVAVASIWLFLLNPSFGLVAGLMKGIGIQPPKSGFLGDAATALPGVTAAFIWYAAGFYVMLFAAGLKSIDGEVMEACELDGASGWTRFWRVTWPLLWSVKRVAITYVAINVVSIFALVQVMTNGGQPDRHTEMPLTYLYEKAFQSSQAAYGITTGVINLILTMGVSLLILFWFRRDPAGRKM